MSATEQPTLERVINLEIRSAHLEHLLQELSEVLYRQQRELEDLTQRQRRLEARTSAQDPGLVDAAARERPPHY